MTKNLKPKIVSKVPNEFYIEIIGPSPGNITFYTDGTYTRELIIKEKFVGRMKCD